MKNKSSKKYIITGAIILLIILLVLTVTAVCLSQIAKRTKAPDEIDYDFYEPNYNLNINDYPEYLEMDRELHYVNEQETKVSVTEENYRTLDNGAEFFYNYINAIRKGDSEAYNSMLHEEYKDVHGEKEKFAPQMLYDIELTYLYDEEIDGNTDAVVYTLEYCIYRNDGTFRRDIGDGSRKQFITVFYDLSTGEAKIHSLQNEYTVVR